MRDKSIMEIISVSYDEGDGQKHCPSDPSLEASDQVSPLDMWLDTEEADHALESKGLSRRESEVLTWLARGKTNSDIGRILHISPRTVSKHLEHIYCKLGVECRTAAVVQLLEILQESQMNQAAIGEKRYSKNAKDRILLVDDDSASRDVLRAIFEYHGYACEEVENGAAALTWLETGRVDLVITDNKMPVLGGLQFLERLATKSKGETPPVIVHSGNLTEEMKENAFENGAYAVLTKPCALSELLPTAARAIQQSRHSKINSCL